MDEPITNTTQNKSKISGIDVNTDPRFQKVANNTTNQNTRPAIDHS